MILVNSTVAALPVPRPSACPGLYRIVPARDGGICRIRLACGQLTARQALALAALAEQHASGLIELTNRSNLQLRGVRAGEEEALIRGLLAAGLGPEQPEADDVRNLLVSPAMDLDPASETALAPLARAILAHLQAEPAFHALSPKFALQLDGGEQIALLSHPHDLWLSLLPGGTRLAFGLAGTPEDPPLASLALDQVLPLLDALLKLFLEQARDGQQRMRQLLETLPVTEFIRQLQQRLDFPLGEAPAQWSRQASSLPPLGLLAQKQPGQQMLGLMPVLGRLTSLQLRSLARLAECFGRGQLRCTPWQGLLLPDIPEDQGQALLLQTIQLELLTDLQEPLARLVACSGSAGCRKGLADTKTDALRLARLLRQSPARPQVHLSGCERSCAVAHRMPYTLLARPGGRYQLYLGSVRPDGQGQLLADALTPDDAARRLGAV